MQRVTASKDDKSEREFRVDEQQRNTSEMQRFLRLRSGQALRFALKIVLAETLFRRSLQDDKSERALLWQAVKLQCRKSQPLRTHSAHPMVTLGSLWLGDGSFAANVSLRASSQV